MVPQATIVEESRTQRQRILGELKLIYLGSLCEDPIDGTHFDCDVLEAIENLEEKYGTRECEW